MIQPDKYDRSLFALHWLFVELRAMAHQHEDYDAFAKITDWAELLPGLISMPTDQTAYFRRILAAIVEIRPGLSQMLDTFDGSGPYQFAGPRDRRTG